MTSGKMMTGKMMTGKMTTGMMITNGMIINGEITNGEITNGIIMVLGVCNKFSHLIPHHLHSIQAPPLTTRTTLITALIVIASGTK